MRLFQFHIRVESGVEFVSVGKKLAGDTIDAVHGALRL
jgi:hypothetical protein